MLGSCKEFFRHRAAHGQRNKINVEGENEGLFFPAISGYGCKKKLTYREEKQDEEGIKRGDYKDM